jgi:glycosyltransferase involved in cell wall biosynthesis
MVDALVVNSEAVRQDLIQHDRVPPGSIHLCRNGLDAEQYQPPGAARTEPVIIGVVCALRPEKGLETLLQAFARLKEPTGAQLLIVGSGPALRGLQALAAQLGINGRCVFEAATKHVPERLRAIHIFVLPSLSEAFSNSLMEAMACGCCVVASRVGGNPELVIEGECGLLFEAGNSADLARCLERLLRDPALRERLALAGTARIREQFTLARAAAQMGEIYRRVLGS